jgi:hypothetical protein
MIADLNTFLTKVIPDTRLTIQKYADAKFEYLVRYQQQKKQNLDFHFDLVVLFESERNG